MVLSDRDILRFQKGDTPLISPFDLSRLRSASYDVTIDDVVTVLSEVAGVVKLSDQDKAYQICTVNHSLEGFVLKLGQYCLVALGETITLPDNLIAQVIPRTRFTRLGLLIEPQYYIPGYTGRLCIGVLNVSGNVVQLAPKMRLRYGSVGIMLLQRIREKRHLLVPRQELEWDAAWSLLSRSL